MMNAYNSSICLFPFKDKGDKEFLLSVPVYVANRIITQAESDNYGFVPRIYKRKLKFTLLLFTPKRYASLLDSKQNQVITTNGVLKLFIDYLKIQLRETNSSIWIIGHYRDLFIIKKELYNDFSFIYLRKDKPSEKDVLLNLNFKE